MGKVKRAFVTILTLGILVGGGYCLFKYTDIWESLTSKVGNGGGGGSGSGNTGGETGGEEGGSSSTPTLPEEDFSKYTAEWIRVFDINNITYKVQRTGLLDKTEDYKLVDGKQYKKNSNTGNYEEEVDSAGNPVNSDGVFALEYLRKCYDKFTYNESLHQYEGNFDPWDDNIAYDNIHIIRVDSEGYMNYYQNVSKPSPSLTITTTYTFTNRGTTKVG